MYQMAHKNIEPFTGDFKQMINKHIDKKINHVHIDDKEIDQYIALIVFQARCHFKEITRFVYLSRICICNG